jgi:serine/threonine protein kinase
VYREIQILNSLYDEEDGKVNHDFTANRIIILKQLMIGKIDNGKYNLGLVFKYYPLCLSQVTKYHRRMKQDKKIKNPYLSQDFVAKSIYQIIEGLQALHKHWILHRDLKPSNILIDIAAGGIIKLCDFGLSKLFLKFQSRKNLEQKEGEMVTLFYRGPELFLTEKSENTHHDSPAMDMWSVGCILCELITTKTLFGVDNIRQYRTPKEQNKQVLKAICFKIGFPTS